MLNKLRPNVIILSIIIALLTFTLATKLIDIADVPLSSEILALLVGVGVGGLVSTLSGVAQDPPPPSVPAHIVEKMLDAQNT